ncbi:MAG: RnfH family protein [Gammaproteobacteria bacterium]|nr:RnfH family protein [Gammaproteobacteria bacterium]
MSDTAAGASADTVSADTVQVVYATPQIQRIVTLERRPGMTAEQAVRASGLLEEFPEIGGRPLMLGVYGTQVALDRVLARGDRVEIARPLQRDPRELRRELLKLGKVMGAADSTRAPERR